jgi:diguanylate cyclase (GGDEF)-like protein/PAS domain S-box-containing protein
MLVLDESGRGTELLEVHGYDLAESTRPGFWNLKGGWIHATPHRCGRPPLHLGDDVSAVRFPGLGWRGVQRPFNCPERRSMPIRIACRSRRVRDPIERSPRLLVVLCLLAFLAYGALLVKLRPICGGYAGGLMLVPVMLSAWATGLRGGLLAATLGLLVNGVVLVHLVSDRPDTSVAIAAVMSYAVAALVGRLADLGRRVRFQYAELAAAQARLRDSEACYRLLFRANPQPMIVADAGSGAILAANEAAVRQHGDTEAEFLDLSIDGLRATGSVLPPGRSDSGECGHGETWRHRRKDGTEIEVEMAWHRITFDGREARLCVMADVTSRNGDRRRLEHRATHDPLTGLPNRALFGERLGRALSCVPLAVLLIDLDRFKAINDGFGHDRGDEVLREFGRRLRAAVREGDTVARLGGDEFGVLLPGAGEVEAGAVAGAIVRAACGVFEVDGLRFSVGVSVGIATHAGPFGDAAEVMRRADAAMYEVKKGGRTFGGGPACAGGGYLPRTGGLGLVL